MPQSDSMTLPQQLREDIDKVDEPQLKAMDG